MSIVDLMVSLTARYNIWIRFKKWHYYPKSAIYPNNKSEFNTNSWNQNTRRGNTFQSSTNINKKTMISYKPFIVTNEILGK